ncbi:MAG: HigA family addiction module antitoxin [Angustibacter sp.]
MTQRIPTHPGAILRQDILPELGLTLTQLAAHLGISRVTLSRVLHEHSAISPNLALRLEAVGLSSALLWLAMQSAHDLAIAAKAGIPQLKPLVVS